ncbi:hypothetical protein GJAV_G00248340 [Gymnothorax javanicus]|nr:hypothetical protein GJAV_G00248340 [Gymnothorax javanicus]
MQDVPLFSLLTCFIELKIDGFMIVPFIPVFHGRRRNSWIEEVGCVDPSTQLFAPSSYFICPRIKVARVHFGLPFGYYRPEAQLFIFHRLKRMRLLTGANRKPSQQTQFSPVPCLRCHPLSHNILLK